MGESKAGRNLPSIPTEYHDEQLETTYERLHMRDNKRKKYKYNPGDMIVSLSPDNTLQAYGYIEKIVWYAPGKKAYVVHLYNKTGDWDDEYGESILDTWKERLDRYMESVGVE